MRTRTIFIPFYGQIVYYLMDITFYLSIRDGYYLLLFACAAINIHVQPFVWTHACISLDYILTVELLGHMVTLYLI
jgi:hypothetical protein